MEYKNVLVEIQDKDFLFTNPVKVFYNFRQDMLIGEAVLVRTEHGIFADIYLIRPLVQGEAHWPAIGYRDTVINQLGICSNPNVDPNIKPLP